MANKTGKGKGKASPELGISLSSSSSTTSITPSTVAPVSWLQSCHQYSKESQLHCSHLWIQVPCCRQPPTLVTLLARLLVPRVRVRYCLHRAPRQRTSSHWVSPELNLSPKKESLKKKKKQKQAMAMVWYKKIP